MQYSRIPYSQTDQSSNVTAQFGKPNLSCAKKLVHMSMDYVFEVGVCLIQYQSYHVLDHYHHQHANDHLQLKTPWDEPMNHHRLSQTSSVPWTSHYMCHKVTAPQLHPQGSSQYQIL